MTPVIITIATTNKGKLREIERIFQGSDIQLQTLADIGWKKEIVEDGATFAENAMIKAREVYGSLKLPVIAEDSGLVVEKLNGAPGIYSARYAGEKAGDEANNKKLLEEIKNIPDPVEAAFVCSAVYFDGETILVSEGRIEGRLVRIPRGENGFGYDPLFLPNGYDKTTAELSPEIKNNISHRGQAMKKLRKMILREE